MTRFLAPLFLALFGVVLAFGILEGIVFRFLLVASDIPALEFKDGLIRYQPNQQGVFRVKEEISAGYKINTHGWNSSHERFRPGSAQDPLIVVLGDSYVEAFHVEVAESFPEQLEQLLGAPHRVYRVAISGAPLSQYLEMLRKQVIALKPQVVIVNLIHNDFDESYRFKEGFYTSSFLKIGASDGSLTEIVPQAFVRPWYSLLRDSASWRYLVNRNGFRPTMIRDAFFSKSAQATERDKEVKPLQTEVDETTKVVTRYLINEIARLTESISAKLLLVMDGDRQTIYEGAPAGRSYFLAHNEMVRDVSDQSSIRFLDLHPIFLNDFELHSRKFNFESDFHWNAYGHSIVAQAVLPVLKELLLQSKTSS